MKTYLKAGIPYFKGVLAIINFDYSILIYIIFLK